jgi:hypothetical protein
LYARKLLTQHLLPFFYYKINPRKSKYALTNSKGYFLPKPTKNYEKLLTKSRITDFYYLKMLDENLNINFAGKQQQLRNTPGTTYHIFYDLNVVKYDVGYYNIGYLGVI